MSPREILMECDGFYMSLKQGGHYVGPMVGYAARDSENKQLVGFAYANFAKIEQWPAICKENVARPLQNKIIQTLQGRVGFRDGITFCGAPLGGLGLSRDLAGLGGSRCIYLEKVVTAVATPTSKEESELHFKRHEPEPDEKVILVEDVCNNFSTTDKAIKKIKDRGAKVVAIVCFLNRSPTYNETFLYEGCRYPIIALWREEMAEYRQTDPEATPFIRARNVVLDPKKEWPRLQAAMQIIVPT